MNHLKKFFLGLAVTVTFVLAGSLSALADCNVSSTVVSGAATLRAEGTTELTATVAVGCTSTVTNPITRLPSNITIVFSPTTTKATVGAGTTTIAAGTIYTLNTVAQNATLGSWANACSTAAPDNKASFPCPAMSSTQPPAATPAVTISGNVVNFNFTPCIAAVAAPDPCATSTGAAQTFYITGIRVNIASTSQTSGALLASIITDGGVGSKQNSSVVFGIIQQTLAAAPVSGFTNATTLTIASCGPVVKTPLGTPATITGNPDTSAGGANSLHVSLSEGFLGAFVTGATNDGGAPAQTTPLSTNGAGIRFRINLTGVPSGFVVYAPEIVNAISAAGTGSVTGGGAATNVTLVTGAALDGSGGGVIAGPVANQYDLLTPSSGAVSVIYEVTSNASVTGLETVLINFALTGTATTGVGAISGVVSLAPVGPPTSNPNLPQFAQINKPGVVANVTLCASYLLYPWAVTTNDGNYDTGLAVANTTSDPSVIGTTGQTGDVTAYFFPSDGSASFSQTLATGLKPGATATFVLSSLKKAFAGYIIVVCNFSLGHGFAFIDNPIAGQNGFAQGYIALSVTNPRMGPLNVTNESVGQ